MTDIHKLVRCIKCASDAKSAAAVHLFCGDIDGVSMVHNTCPLLQACVAQKMQTLTALLDRGVNVHVRSSQTRNTPACVCASHKDAAMLKVLLDRRPDADLSGALHCAAYSGNAAAARVLVDVGADLTEMVHGATASRYALSNALGSIDLALWLHAQERAHERWVGLRQAWICAAAVLATSCAKLAHQPARQQQQQQQPQRIAHTTRRDRRAALRQTASSVCRLASGQSCVMLALSDSVSVCCVEAQTLHICGEYALVIALFL